MSIGEQPQADPFLGSHDHESLGPVKPELALSSSEKSESLVGRIIKFVTNIF